MALGRAAPWIVSVAAFALAAPALLGDFVLDDAVAVTGSACVTGPLDLGRIFSSTFWCEDPSGPVQTASWRPATVTVWWLLFRLGGGAAPFHLLSALLHAACAGLLVLVSRALGASDRAATAGGVCFAVLAIHAEVAAGVVGAAAGWATLFVLVAVLAAASTSWSAGARVSLSFAAAALACAAREDGVLVLPLVALVCVAGWKDETGDRKTRLSCAGTLYQFRCSNVNLRLTVYL